MPAAVIPPIWQWLDSRQVKSNEKVHIISVVSDDASGAWCRFSSFGSHSVHFITQDQKEPKVTTLVLARLTVSCRCLQKRCKALICRCSPAGVVDMMVSSSAYSRSGTSLRGKVHHAQVCPSGVAPSHLQTAQRVLH